MIQIKHKDLENVTLESGVEQVNRDNKLSQCLTVPAIPEGVHLLNPPARWHVSERETGKVPRGWATVCWSHSCNCSYGKRSPLPYSKHTKASIATGYYAAKQMPCRLRCLSARQQPAIKIYGQSYLEICDLLKTSNEQNFIFYMLIVELLDSLEGVEWTGKSVTQI